MHRHDLVQFQQPGQMERIPSIGLDPISREGRCSFEGAATTHAIPAPVNRRNKPNPVGPASYTDFDTPGSERIHATTSASS